MRILRHPVRVAVWMATPVVVWATSFLGGWLGARTGGTMAWLLGGGVSGGLLGFVLWVLLIRYLGKRWAKTPEMPESGQGS